MEVRVLSAAPTSLSPAEVPLFAFRKNQTLTYTYDQLNRLLQKAYPDSTAVNYTYDNDSRLTQVTDPTGTYQFTFDNMGRLTVGDHAIYLPDRTEFRDELRV